MPTEQLELWANETLFGEIGHQLVPKQMGIDTLANPRSPRVLLDNLAQVVFQMWIWKGNNAL